MGETPFTTSIQADEAKLKDYRAELRQHEIQMATIRRAMKIVESRLGRLKEKARPMSLYAQHQADYPKLFKWAFDTFNARTETGVPQRLRTPALMVRLLSVEGVRNDLLCDEMVQGAVPRDLEVSLRCFRQLSQEGRARKAAKLLKEWSE